MIRFCKKSRIVLLQKVFVFMNSKTAKLLNKFAALGGYSRKKVKREYLDIPKNLRGRDLIRDAIQKLLSEKKEEK